MILKVSLIHIAKIYPTRTEQNFIAGLKLRITTPVKGNPIPTFSWTKDGKPLSGDRVHAFSDGELVNAITS